MRLGFALLALFSAGCGVRPGLEALLDAGHEAEACGVGESAGESYRKAAEAYPEESAAWADLGEWQRFWGHDPVSAQGSFDRALKAPHATRSALALAWRGMGEIARKGRDLDRALACFERSLSIHPTAEAHRSLAALYAVERRDFPKAAGHARAAVALAPEDPVAMLQCAILMQRLGSPEEAEGMFGRAFALPVNCCVLYNGACYQAVRGDHAKALALLERFFQDPNHHHNTRADVLGDPDLEALRGDPGFRALADRYLKE